MKCLEKIYMIFGLKYLPKISKQIMHCGSVVKNPPVNAGDARDAGSIPGSRRSPRVGNGNPVQYSFFFFLLYNIVLVPVFLPGKSHGERSLVGYSPCGLIELDMAEYSCTHTCKQKK